MITAMLLPDNIHPENSIYYNGAIVLNLIQQYKCIELTELYILVKEKKNMSYPILILCLDWLYLLNAAVINKEGEVCLCS
jgi:hypothetical protein